MIHRGRDIDAEVRLSADAVVIGSGCGGAVVAEELASAGKKVVVLEEGGYFSREQYSAFKPSEAMRYLYRDYGAVPALGVGDSPTIFVMAGKCVGGSSLVNGGVCFRTPPEVLESWRDQLGLKEIGLSEMDEAFSRVEKKLSVTRTPEALLNKGMVKVQAAARRLGYSHLRIDRNVKDCDGCCRCIFGCPHDRKQSVLSTYLARAVSRGTEIFADCRAEKLLVQDGRAAGVVGTVKNAESGRGHPVRVDAPVVVLAAGALHTPVLLMRNGVGRHSHAVGQHLTLHPSFRIYARFDEDIEGWKGAFQSFAVDQFHKEAIKLINLFPPAGVIASGLPGLGAAASDLMRDVRQFAAMGAMISDTSTGRVRRGLHGRPFVTYKLNGLDKSRMARAMGVLGELFFEAGAKTLFMPFHPGTEITSVEMLRQRLAENLDMRLVESASHHPLGTARMGVDPRSSVVDAEGEAHDLPGLFVADGSIVPSSVAVNPQITIMGLATRIASRLLARPLARTQVAVA